MSSDLLARTPEVPYWSVIFTSRLTEGHAGYVDAASRMLDLARQQAGFLGVDSARGEDGIGITVSYWRDLEAVRAFGRIHEHRIVQAQGREKWYRCFSLRVAKVEEERLFGLD